MSFLTINAFRRRDRQRQLLVACLLVVIAPLQVHPSVLALLRILPESLGSPGLPEVGYVVHLVVYFVLTLLVLSSVRPERGEQDVMIATTLLLHGAVTELIQIWLPGNHWNLHELTCNLTGVLVAGSIYLAWCCRRSQLSMIRDDRLRETRKPVRRPLHVR